MTLMSLLEAAAKFKAIERDLHQVGPAIVARACEMVCKEIKEVLGSYHYGWEHLQPSTIAKKMLGDTPLFETGELRDSIQWTSSGNEGEVGSNLDRALWMEFGTSRGIPPRPFILPTAIAMEKKIYRMAARAVMAVMAGKGLHATELGELIHFLRSVKHALEAVVDAIPDADNEKTGERRR